MPLLFGDLIKTHEKHWNLLLLLLQILQLITDHLSLCKHLFPVSDLDKREDSDAEKAEVMSSFINLICNFSDKMTNKIL